MEEATSGGQREGVGPARQPAADGGGRPAGAQATPRMPWAGKARIALALAQELTALGVKDDLPDLLALPVVLASSD